MRARSSVGRRSGYLRGTASHTRCRSHDIGVCPSGTFCFGRAGLARRSGNASSSASVTRARDRAGVAREPRRHLGPRAQVRAGVRRAASRRARRGCGSRAPPRPPRPACVALGDGVVHVVGREDRQPALGGERGEHVVVGASRADRRGRSARRARARARTGRRGRSSSRAAASGALPPPAPGARRPCGIRSGSPSARRPRSRPAHRGRRSGGPSRRRCSWACVIAPASRW